jgi:hypothetical protein
MECEPPRRVAQGDVLALMSKHDIGKRHWIVQQRLSAIRAGEWPGAGGNHVNEQS